MALWKCLNEECARTGQQFEADDGRCPECKLPWSVPLEAVHYVVPAEGPIRTGLGNRMMACNPKAKTLPEFASGVREAVTCPKCRATDIFQEDEHDGINNNVPWMAQRMGDGKH